MLVGKDWTLLCVRTPARPREETQESKPGRHKHNGFSHRRVHFEYLPNVPNAKVTVLLLCKQISGPIVRANNEAVSGAQRTVSAARASGTDSASQTCTQWRLFNGREHVARRDGDASRCDPPVESVALLYRDASEGSVNIISTATKKTMRLIDLTQTNKERYWRPYRPQPELVFYHRRLDRQPVRVTVGEQDLKAKRQCKDPRRL